MKALFALMLFVVSAFAHAEVSMEEVHIKMAEARAALVKSTLPHRRSLTVDELADTMEMHDVDILVSTKPMDNGAVYFQGVIIIGAEMAALPREQLAYVLAHEYGHHTRMHWRSFLSRGAGLAQSMGKTVTSVEELASFAVMAVTPMTSHSDELDADRAAVVTLRKFGLYNEKAIAAVLHHFGDADSDSHPGASARVKAMSVVN
jgi:Zn-dependent protease with chaperone function